MTEYYNEGNYGPVPFDQRGKGAHEMTHEQCRDCYRIAKLDRHLGLCKDCYKKHVYVLTHDEEEDGTELYIAPTEG